MDRLAGKVAAIAGAGPGNGAAIARRLAREGYRLALLARSADYLAQLAGELRAQGARIQECPVDLADLDDVAEAFRKIRGELGQPDVLVQNAAPMERGPFLEVPPERFEKVFRVSVMGMVHCCRAVLPDMVAQGSGAVIVVGATGALRGSAGFAPFAVGKFGQRALAQALAREFGPRGVHVAHVIIDGVIETPTTRRWLPEQDASFFLQPEHIAETIWHLIEQPRSAWTHEIDLRPFGEKF
jgi:NADP-dependent 3-hydroxy acid dehydrogenase YdfG